MDLIAQTRGDAPLAPVPVAERTVASDLGTRPVVRRPPPAAGSGRGWLVAELAAGMPILAVAAVAGWLSGVERSRWLWLIVGLFAAFVLLWMGAVLLQRRLVNLRRRVSLHQSREMLLGAEREALLHEALLVADRERQRLAADLHDGVIQLVSAITLRTATLSRGVRRDAHTSERLSDWAASLDRITIDLQAVTADLRTLMGALAGDDIQSDGLTGALSALLLPLAESGAEVHVSVGEVGDDPQARTLVHRIVQELVRNVAKHAAATRVSVSVGEEEGVVRLRITDNGRGFDLAELEDRRHRGHLGLRLLNQRVRDAGGELTIHTSPGHGTTVDVTFPAAAVLPEAPAVTSP